MSADLCGIGLISVQSDWSDEGRGDRGNAEKIDEGGGATWTVQVTAMD